MRYLVLILNFAVKYLIPIDRHVETWVNKYFVNIFSYNAHFLTILL